MVKLWKKGRGKLGILQPLLGQWEATAETPLGPTRCTRKFEPALGRAYVRLEALWEFGGPGKGYEELALFGVGDEGRLTFWSFTSDGKRSQGVAADVTDLHPEAIGFEAQMPAGLARMAYWPVEDGGFFFVVESKRAAGWNRFLKHHYRPA